MRRPIKPFVTEFRGGRRSSSPPKPSALFDDDIFKGDERPPRDLNDDGGDDDSYESALRAADALFNKSGGGEKTAAPEGVRQGPPPQPPSAQPPSSSRTSSTNEAQTAAELLFAKPAEAASDDDKTAAGADADADKRVLTDLSYRDPLEERLAAAKAVRRGRKPGSKNKPKTPGDVSLIDDYTPKVASAPGKRGRPLGSKNKPKIDQPTMSAPVEAVHEHAAPTRTQVPSSHLRVDHAPRAAIPVRLAPRALVGHRSKTAASEKVKPGERWKLRLNRHAR